MLATAAAVGLTTDWNVRRIAARQVANVMARHSTARLLSAGFFLLHSPCHGLA